MKIAPVAVEQDRALEVCVIAHATDCPIGAVHFLVNGLDCGVGSADRPSVANALTMPRVPARHALDRINSTTNPFNHPAQPDTLHETPSDIGPDAHSGLYEHPRTAGLQSHLLPGFDRYGLLGPDVLGRSQPGRVSALARVVATAQQVALLGHSIATNRLPDASRDVAHVHFALAPCIRHVLANYTGSPGVRCDRIDGSTPAPHQRADEPFHTFPSAVVSRVQHPDLGDDNDHSRLLVATLERSLVSVDPLRTDIPTTRHPPRDGTLHDPLTRMHAQP